MTKLYYPDRKLLRDMPRKRRLLRWVVDRLDKPLPAGWKSDVITLEAVNRVLSVPGLTFQRLPKGSAHFLCFHFNKSEQWYEHQEFGKVFIPRSICMAEDESVSDNYFLVVIDDAIEYRWNLATTNALGVSTVEGTRRRVMRYMEAAFSALYDYLFEADAEAREGTPIDRADLENLLDGMGVYLDGLADDILFAAHDPCGYFEQHDTEYDKPNKGDYINILLQKLVEEGHLGYFDWKEEAAEVEHFIRQATGIEGAVPVEDEDGHALATCDALEAASERLRGKGIALLNMDDRSDSYHLFAVPLDKADSVIEHAERCGIAVCPAQEA